MSETTCHLVAGGTAGTVGAILTSPLEVIKTRLQSSVYQFFYTSAKQAEISTFRRSAVVGCMSLDVQSQLVPKRTLFRQPLDCLKDIIRNEGYRGLFKGLTPTIFGVAPTRAIFFFTYQNCKGYFCSSFDADVSIAHFYALHGLSATIAGFTSLTLTNPIWLVKTRLQLDNKHNSLVRTIKRIYRQSGVRGFYKGIAASYLGIAETVVHIVFYEELKRIFVGSNSDASFYPVSSTFEMIRVLAVSATSKTIATSLMYPHEVLRTRLRQEDSRYKSLRQCIPLILREEGWRAFYRGLGVHIFRQVPNAAITMAVYELVVSALSPYPAQNNTQNCSGVKKVSWPFKSSSSESSSSSSPANSSSSTNSSSRPLTISPVSSSSSLPSPIPVTSQSDSNAAKSLVSQTQSAAA